MSRHTKEGASPSASPSNTSLHMKHSSMSTFNFMSILISAASSSCKTITVVYSLNQTTVKRQYFSNWENDKLRVFLKKYIFENYYQFKAKWKSMV